MSRIDLVSAQSTTPDRQALLEQVNSAFGATPNMFRAVANSPAALQSLWGSFGALGSGSVSAALGEKIAVAVADRNGCEYCLAAHTALGQNAGVNSAELVAAQAGESPDAKVAAALRFALKLVNDRGHVSDTDFEEVRKAGYSDEEIVEIIAHVGLNLFTNYINIALEVPVDFPAVKLRRNA